MTDLEKLIPQAFQITAGGETLAVKPLKIGQIPAFLRAISPVMQQLAGSEIDWLSLFGQHGEDLLSAVAIAVGKPREWVDELSADEAIVLAAKVIEVNADFFTHTVIPKIGNVFDPVRPPAASHPVTPAGSMRSNT